MTLILTPGQCLDSDPSSDSSCQKIADYDSDSDSKLAKNGVDSRFNFDSESKSPIFGISIIIDNVTIMAIYDNQTTTELEQCKLPFLILTKLVFCFLFFVSFSAPTHNAFSTLMVEPLDLGP